MHATLIICAPVLVPALIGGAIPLQPLREQIRIASIRDGTCGTQSRAAEGRGLLRLEQEVLPDGVTLPGFHRQGRGIERLTRDEVVQ
jgi:hypothetical protein